MIDQFNGLLLYQKTVIAVSAVLILRTSVLFLFHKKTVRELIVSTLFWGSIMIIVTNIHLIDRIAKIAGFQLGINALLVASTIFLGYTSIRLYLKTDKMEQAITEIVRKESLKKIKDKD